MVLLETLEAYVVYTISIELPAAHIRDVWGFETMGNAIVARMGCTM